MRCSRAPREAEHHLREESKEGRGNAQCAQRLEERSEEFGLCRTYENEWWHFEVTGDIGDPCPEMKSDASLDW